MGSALSLMLKEWEDGAYIYNSWRTFSGGGYEPMAGDVAPDNKEKELIEYDDTQKTKVCGVLCKPLTRRMLRTRSLTAMDAC